MPKTNNELMADYIADALIDGGIITSGKKAEVVAIWKHIAKGMIDYMELKGVPKVDGVDGTISFNGE